MDTTIIEARKNIIVSKTLAGAGTSNFNFTINNVQFIPDEVIIKNIIYCSTADEPGLVTNIYTNLVSEMIGSFLQDFSIKPDTHFILRKGVNQQWNIQLSNLDGTPNTTRGGDLSIIFEFVKYAEVKPQKIH